MASNLKASGKPLLKSDPNAPSRASSPSVIRQWDLPGVESLAKDIEKLSGHLDSLHATLANTAPSLNQIALTNAQGQLVAAFGDLVYQGVQYTNYLSELHVADPLLKHDPANALFNANTDGSVVIGESGWLDVLDPWQGHAAWIGTQNDTLPVTGAVDNGNGLIELTLVSHTLVTGNVVRVQNVGGIGESPPPGGTFANNATGIQTVTVVDADTIDLQNTVFAGAYTSGGVVDRVLQIDDAEDNGSGLIRITTDVPHLYETGDQVDLQSLPGVLDAETQFVIVVVDATNFDCTGSAFAGAYTGGGTCLRYFAGMLAQTVAIGASFSDYKLRMFADGELKIKNASITLISAAGEMVLDPTGPSFTSEAFDGSGNVTAFITLNAAVPDIVISKPGSGQIVLDGSVPNIALYNAAGTLVVKLDPNAAAPVEVNGSPLTPVSGSSTPTTVVTGVNFSTQTVTTQTMNYANGVYQGP